MGFQITFTQWLNQFKNEKSDRGILARLVSSTSSFPNKHNKNSMLSYLKKSGASPEMLNIFELAWDEFIVIPLARIPYQNKFGRRGRAQYG